MIKKLYGLGTRDGRMLKLFMEHRSCKHLLMSSEAAFYPLLKDFLATQSSTLQYCPV